MKKLLSILAVLAIVLVTCIMGIGTVASAAEESPEEDFLVYDGVLEEYVGPGGDVVIPASLGVKEIAAKAFFANNDITSVVIPEGVEVVGYWCFNMCEAIEAVTLPYSLEELAEHCFSSAAITSIVIPGNVETIGYGAFSGCTYLSELTISYGVRELQVLCFQGTSIQKMIFPETVELICGSAFTNNKDATIGKIEIYICNPDCEVGPTAGNSADAYKQQWTSEFSPWSHNTGDAQYRVYVPENSEVLKWFEESFRENLDKSPSGVGDGIKITAKPQSYFDELPENQEGYGTQPPEKEDTSTETTDKGEEGGTGTNGNGNKKPTASNSDNNLSGGSTTVVQQSSNSTMLIIILCAFAGLILIVIIVVVILAATGKLFAKPAVAPQAIPAEPVVNANDPAALKAALEALEKKEQVVNANDPEALRAALAALENKDAE